MAEIGWIDFSPEHRQRVGAILDMLKPEGMVDELGVGIIRDALADEMFPGFSTIQTRAKYFFIIPYILFEYQRLKRRNMTAAQYLEKRENEVMWELAKKYDYEDGSGVIGITKRKPQTIARRPSEIYWNGLYVYGLINHQGQGVETFLRRRALTAESLSSLIEEEGDDVARDDADAEHENFFNLKLTYDDKWADNLDLNLTWDEADLFLHRIHDVGRGKLVGELVDSKTLFTIFNKSKEFHEFVEGAKEANIDSASRRVMTLAHDFSEVMYGAHIAYNCLLQEKKFNSKESEALWREWLAELRKSMMDYGAYDPDMLFEYARTARGFTRNFVKDWWEFVRGSEHDLKRRNRLISDQEYVNKGAKSRLRAGKMDDVQEGGWIGLRRLSYRMDKVKRILNDIFQALKK